MIRRRYILTFSMALLALLSSPVYAQEDGSYAMGAMVLSVLALVISIAAIVLTSYLVGKKKKED